MLQKKFITDLRSCRSIWRELIPPRLVSDIWEFRLCFQRNFRRRPCFIVLEDRKGIAGMLPLSYVEEMDSYIFFPGETWNGKSWLERTPFYWRSKEFIPEILASCPDRTHLRYMEPLDGCTACGSEVDEIGYLLYPSQLVFDISNYLNRFSTKRLKNIRKEIQALMVQGGVFHMGRMDDFARMVAMNIERFGSDSFFYDTRFTESFRDVMYFLNKWSWLRMVSLEINGRIVAVDLGAVYGGTYVVFLGGTRLGLSGLAKAMNMHHLEFAFNEKLSRVDFLCGDFHWKKLWHLDSEPLFKFLTPALIEQKETFAEEKAAVPLSF
jgi:hypothetical protein